MQINFNHNKLRLITGFIAANGLSFCLWKPPAVKNINMIAGVSSRKSLDQIKENEFIFSDFESKMQIIIDPSLLILENTIIINKLTQAEELTGLKNEKFHFYYDKFSSNENRKTSKNLYTGTVNKAISILSKDSFIKVVLARNKIISLQKDFDIFDFFIALTENYVNAFVYLFSSAHTGTWIGASPELLAEYTKGKVHTISLAGTRQGKAEDKNISFSQKDKFEQEIVSKHIRECFENNGVDFKEISAVPIFTGHLYHLRSDFFCSDNNINILKFISDLQPTPAVSGYPKKMAIKFIEEFENLPRKFYAGFLGFYKNKKDFSFYVNIRCMEIKKDKAILYAGAGILKDSDPDTEWQETEDKIQTLLRFL